MPDRPEFAATGWATARPRRVSSVAVSAIDRSRSTFFGRLAQPETRRPRAIAPRIRDTEVNGGETRAIGLGAVGCNSTEWIAAVRKQCEGSIRHALPRTGNSTTCGNIASSSRIRAPVAVEWHRFCTVLFLLTIVSGQSMPLRQAALFPIPGV